MCHCYYWTYFDSTACESTPSLFFSGIPHAAVSCCTVSSATLEVFSQVPLGDSALLLVCVCFCVVVKLCCFWEDWFWIRSPIWLWLKWAFFLLCGTLNWRGNDSGEIHQIIVVIFQTCCITAIDHRKLTWILRCTKFMLSLSRPDCAFRFLCIHYLFSPWSCNFPGPNESQWGPLLTLSTTGLAC